MASMGFIIRVSSFALMVLVIERPRYHALLKPFRTANTLKTRECEKSYRNFLYCYGSLIKGLYFDNTISASPADKQDD